MEQRAPEHRIGFGVCKDGKALACLRDTRDVYGIKIEQDLVNDLGSKRQNRHSEARTSKLELVKEEVDRKKSCDLKVLKWGRWREPSLSALCLAAISFVQLHCRWIKLFHTKLELHTDFKKCTRRDSLMM